MDGLFYFMSVAGVGLVMWWVMQNDQIPLNRPTRGLFALIPGRLLLKRRGLRDLLARESKTAAAAAEAPPRRKSPF